MKTTLTVEGKLRILEFVEKQFLAFISARQGQEQSWQDVSSDNLQLLLLKYIENVRRLNVLLLSKSIAWILFTVG